MIYKLRPSIAVVELENRIEFFLTNIRKSISLEGLTEVKEFLFKFDGKKELEEILENENLDERSRDEAKYLIEYLNEKNILLKIDENYKATYKEYPRVYNLLEDYFNSVSKVNKAFERVKTSRVMIIGLGAVGTWVAHNLVMSGVENLILVDFDKVELSNLHRQVGFFSEDIGRYKIDALSDRLLEFNENLKIIKIKDKLDSEFFKRIDFTKIDLIINCADYPSVDKTSIIVGEYCMKNNINHLIGGGYNLHLSLIGQVVIPGKTACVKCFEKSLEELNKIDTKNIKKLENKDRKVGSFSPLTSLSASITSNEAFKCLAGISELVMNDNRSEFLIKDMNFRNIKMTRRKDCDWCGEEGEFYRI
ncbi:HesA/MoeB/ThiF family protein [Cetobacterium somerae]